MTLATRKVYNLEALDLLGRLGDGSVGAVVTDPPFFIGVNQKGSHGGTGNDPWTGESTIDDMIAWSDPVAREVCRVLRPGGSCWVMGGVPSIAAWEVAAERSRLVLSDWVTVLWNSGKARRYRFGSLTTQVRRHVKGKERPTFRHGKQAVYSNVIVAKKVHPRLRLHPTQKPVGLTSVLIAVTTEPGDLIVDPFCGSGSTLVSAEALGRPWIGGDTDPYQCSIAEARTGNLEDEDLEMCPFWQNGQEVYTVTGDDDDPR